MSRDYKPQQSPRSNGGRGMNPMFIGIIIGLLLGVSIALGVALWLNKSAIPFIAASKPLEPPAKFESKTPPKAEPAKPGDAAKTPEKPRFEFYQILPGDKDGTKSASKPPAKPVDAKPVAKPAEKSPERLVEKAAPATREVFYLQAGAFQNLADADNLKAKIAFTGLQATVTQANVPDKGVLHRVRLGPYQSLEDVNRIKSVLSDNGVSASVVKTTDTLN